MLPSNDLQCEFSAISSFLNRDVQIDRTLIMLTIIIQPIFDRLNEAVKLKIQITINNVLTTNTLSHQIYKINENPKEYCDTVKLQHRKLQ